MDFLIPVTLSSVRSPVYTQKGTAMGRKELIAAFARDRYRTVKLSGLVLIEHLDGRHVRLPPPHSQERMTTLLLQDRGALRWVHDGAATKITEAGRATLAEILADMAEILSQAADPLAHTIETAPEYRPQISTEMS